MTVAAAYLGEPWRLPIQLGALYCLFTIYTYQIEEPKIKVRQSSRPFSFEKIFVIVRPSKIRLTVNTWNSLLDQMESSADIPSDAKILLCKLIDENAFVISATRHEVSISFFPLDILLVYLFRLFRWVLDFSLK